MKKKVQITKVVYKKLGREKAFGQTFKDGGIHIDPRINGKTKMATIIHEWAHDNYPDWSENKVNEFEKKLVNFLWDLNFRIVDNKKR